MDTGFGSEHASTDFNSTRLQSFTVPKPPPRYREVPFQLLPAQSLSRPLLTCDSVPLRMTYPSSSATQILRLLPSDAHSSSAYMLWLICYMPSCLTDSTFSMGMSNHFICVIAFYPLAGANHPVVCFSPIPDSIPPACNNLPLCEPFIPPTIPTPCSPSSSALLA